MTRAERERMLQAILYFTLNTRDAAAMKVFKLLYLLDVKHFQATGRTVTGLQYSAHNGGPSPDDLGAEFLSPRRDLAQLVRVNTTVVSGKDRHTLSSAAKKSALDLEVFSSRQLDLLDLLSKAYETATPEQIQVDQEDNGALANALAAGKGRAIDLSEAVPEGDPDRHHKLAVAAEYDRRASYLRAVA
jgi:hypothetical protein